MPQAKGTSSDKGVGITRESGSGIRKDSHVELGGEVRKGVRKEERGQRSQIDSESAPDPFPAP